MGDIKSLLAALAKLQKASGASSAAKETTVLAGLAESGDLAARINEIDLVVHFLDALRAAREDKAQFDQVLQDMKKPGLLSDTQVKSIARQHLETKSSFKTKAAAIEAIRDARARDDRLQGKLKAS